MIIKYFLSLFFLFFLANYGIKAQYFNDFYIKQQLGFYEEKDSDAYNALEVLRKFILEKDKPLFVKSSNNDYFEKFINTVFNPYLPQNLYSYVPTTYYIKNNVIVFEIDVIESAEINNKTINIVYANVFIPIDLKKNLILLDEKNIDLFPNINRINYKGINVISNHVLNSKREILEIKKYIHQKSKVLSISNSVLQNGNLTIFTSNNLNDGYFYYGINKYVNYVNNYSKNKIFAGNRPLFYKHELIHYLLNLKTKDKINPIIDEGLATWLGGSTKYSYNQFLKKSLEGKSNSEIDLIIDNFLSDNNSDNNNKYEYFIRSLFVNAVFKSEEKLDQMILDKLINGKMYDFSINQLIKELNLDKHELKKFIKTKINEIIKS
ncbi:hypothetical protein [Chishuiella sp.]|uniref:hypothetical protein n=1 Tax=Chishuiella sp. TaxID=1969467 RepID=UPI0028B1CCA1|nr:hypothetical protein [Chishuiella sp.]